MSLTHPPTWSVLPVRSDFTGTLLSLPFVDSHSHTSTWDASPADLQGHWATLPGMPEGNKDIRNGKISRQLNVVEHGYVIESHHFFISSILDFPAVTRTCPHLPLSLHTCTHSLGSQTSLPLSFWRQESG